MRKFFLVLYLMLPIAGIATAADTVPTDIQMPGTQPMEISNLESPGKCDNCHGGYNSAVEPSHNWAGSMMAQAGRDPIFWATMAIAEQDFDGSGDLCIRCHSTSGWLAGRSTPTDGSGLQAGDADGVECDYCHKLTNPDDSNIDLQGVMNGEFISNGPDGEGGLEGWFGSGMSSMWSGSDKLGPFNDAEARHQFMQSDFHRDPEFCGTCHDVSNPVTGDLAHNHGRLTNQPDLLGGGTLGGPVKDKIAFNNPPYAYGVVERTFSEHMSSPLSTMEVDSFPGSGLPEHGAFEALYLTARDNSVLSADYTNPARARTYTCQTCHMRPVVGTGANKRGVPIRNDLPLHDMTGGNYWMAYAIEWLNSEGLLRLGNGLTTAQVDAMKDAAFRAKEQLQLAATLDVAGDTLTITNHTGHKLITGYPEGRRMWLNLKWYDSAGNLLREDGKYGDITVSIDGVPTTVRSILELHPSDHELYIFEAHMGMTKAWAEHLISLGYRPDLPLTFDRLDGTVEKRLADLASMESADDSLETFHFVLNNTVVEDNRIPPFQMSYDEARRRNASPVPADQYGGSAGGTYNHFATVDLKPPSGASYATIDLLYQPTSWEYIQFLYEANNGTVTFLANEGKNMLDAWTATGMAEPIVMNSATWGETAPEPVCDLDAPSLDSIVSTSNSVTISWTPVQGVDSYDVFYDSADKSQPLVNTTCSETEECDYTDDGLTSAQTYCYKVTALQGTRGQEGFCDSDFSNDLCIETGPSGQTPSYGVASITTGSIIRTGKGKNATEEYQELTTFSPGDTIIIRMPVYSGGTKVSGASVNLAITGPESVNLTSSASDSNGIAEVSWSTQAPNKKGNGGTTPGAYSIKVTGISSSNYEWDKVETTASVTLQ